MDDINKLNETGGAGDWGTDKARARLQKDTPGQNITKGKKMKTFKDVLQQIDEASFAREEISERVHYAFDTQDGAREFQKKVAGMPMNIVKVGSSKYYVVELRPGANQGVQDKAAKIAVSIGLSEEFYNIAEGYETILEKAYDANDVKKVQQLEKKFQALLKEVDKTMRGSGISAPAFSMIRGGIRKGLESIEKFYTIASKNESVNISESTRDYVDNILPKALKKAGVNCNITKKQGYTSYDCGNGYQIINNGVGIEVKKDIPRGKDVFYYNKPRLDYKKVVSQVSESQSIEEAMSAADKKKRLAMIKQAVEKINRNNAEKAKKDALAMMKASGMFDEEVELDEALGNANPSHTDKVKIDKDGTVHNLPGKKIGSAYNIKMRVDGGKLTFGTVDNFGNISTMTVQQLLKVLK